LEEAAVAAEAKMQLETAATARGCIGYAILLRKVMDNLFLYFKLDRLPTPIIDIFWDTDYLPICR
jgi:hypothetical protein